MSDNHEKRLSDVEREQVRQGERLGRIESDVGKIGAGVERLLERDAKRPPQMTWSTIGATAGGLAAVAAVGWWLVGSAPAVQALKSEIGDARQALKSEISDARQALKEELGAVSARVTRLDDPEIGRVPAVERRVRELEAWQPRVTRY